MTSFDLPRYSILLISPQNRILLLRRVKTSNNFASAYVFPGGNISAQDGDLPPISDPRCHEDSRAYRMAAIRECFEESGILLARAMSKDSSEEVSGESPLVELSEEERDLGRKEVHAEQIKFADWLDRMGAQPDLEGLIPFTRWLTPAALPTRYTTQMYLYFLPLESSLGATSRQMQIPTPDGGVEHNAAQFQYAQEWVEQSLRKGVLLFPPQFFLTSIVAGFLKPLAGRSSGDQSQEESTEELQQQRQRFLKFVQEDDNPPWGEKCISPDPARREEHGKYLIMGLANAGPELQGTGRRGETKRIIRVELEKEIERGRRRPHAVEVMWKTSSGQAEKSKL